MDAADLGRGEVDLGGLGLIEEGIDSVLVGEVQLGVRACEDVGVSGLRQLSNDGRTDHAAVAGDVDWLVLVGWMGHRGKESF